MRKSFTEEGRLCVAGHRGHRVSGYENTMKAFREAIACGVDMIETDVRLTKDRVLVLVHDETVDRTSDHTGRVKDYTFLELRQMNFGTPADPLPVPTLAELLALLQGTSVTLNLEFKEYASEDNQADCVYCIDEALKLVDAYGMKEQTLCNSFDAYVLEYIAAHYPGAYLLHGFYPYSILMNVRRNPDEYLHCACIFDIGEKSYFDYLVSRQIEPWVGAGVKSKEQLALCLQNGARLVTSDAPQNTLAMLAELH